MPKLESSMLNGVAVIETIYIHTHITAELIKKNPMGGWGGSSSLPSNYAVSVAAISGNGTNPQNVFQVRLLNVLAKIQSAL